MVAPTLADYQMQFEDTGTLLNGSATVPFIDIEKIVGLDAPEGRITTEDYTSGHGSYVEAQYLKARTVSIEGTLYCPPNDLTFWDALKGNFFPQPDARPLYFKLPGREQQVVFGKPLGGIKGDVQAGIGMGVIPFQVQIACEDPRIYASTPQAPSTTLPVSSGGRAYPRTYPVAYGSSGSGGSLQVINNGNFRDGAAAVLRVSNNTLNPRIELIGTGKFLKVNIQLFDGDTLDIDLQYRTILLNGTASRRNALTSDSTWFLIPPGSQQLNFRADAYSATSTLSIPTFRSAWT